MFGACPLAGVTTQISIHIPKYGNMSKIFLMKRLMGRVFLVGRFVCGFIYNDASEMVEVGHFGFFAYSSRHTCRKPHS